jgi:hypothetical protein
MAFCQPADGKIASFYYAMCADGVLRVTGTTGIEPAMVTQERAQASSVAGNEEYKEAAH